MVNLKKKSVLKGEDIFSIEDRSKIFCFKKDQLNLIFKHYLVGARLEPGTYIMSVLLSNCSQAQ